MERIMGKWSLRWQLLGGFIVAIVMFVLLLTVLSVMNRTVATNLDLVGEDVGTLVEVAEVPVTLGEADGFLSRLVYTPSEALRRTALEGYEQAAEQVRREMADVDELVLSERQEALTDALQTAVDDLLALHARQVALINDGDQ